VKPSRSREFTRAERTAFLDAEFGTDDPNRVFIARTLDLLGVSAVIDDFGAARKAQVVLDGQLLEIGCGGHLWIRSDLDWPSFPAGSRLAFAPVGGHERNQHLDFELRVVSTGDREFDDAYLLIGDDDDAPAALAAQLTPALRAALLAATDLWPSLRGGAFGDYRGEPARARASLNTIPRLWAPALAPGFVLMGTEQFTPIHLADAARAHAALAAALSGSGAPAARTDA
jgi:hypothetical protein